MEFVLLRLKITQYRVFYGAIIKADLVYTVIPTVCWHLRLLFLLFHDFNLGFNPGFPS